MPSLKDLLTQSAALHRHLCPRQVLGVRMGSLAGEILGLALPQDRSKRLFVFMETDGCAADGVSVASGCWPGRRTMYMVDHGKVAATFVDTKTLQALRIHPHPDARRLAAARCSNARSRWHAQLKAYQTMPDDELLIARTVRLTIDIEALISRPGVRTRCQACGEEIINQREVCREGGVLCRACAGRSYWALLPAPRRHRSPLPREAHHSPDA